MINRRIIAIAAIAAVSALGLAGCSGSGGDVNAIITADGTEPQNPLIPSATNETGGGKIIDMVFAGLVYYDDKGKIHNELAESIEGKDAQHFTIKIKKGKKFSDGTEVKAENFVKAWKDAAKASNKRLSGYFMEPIVGYNEEADSDLTGLKVVDDHTFTVELKAPTSDFPQRLGYSAYVPLPDSAFDDKGNVTKEFGENPVGAGSYMLAKKGAWVHNEKIDLVPNPKYDGDRKAKNGGVELKFYPKLDAAYNDLLSGNLDVLQQVPDSQYKSYEKDLPDRTVNQPQAVFQAFAIPTTIPHFGGEEGKLRKQAISMSINREEVIKQIFNGTRTAATDFTSPVIDGYKKDLKGSEVLKFNVAKAKELWAKADAISPWDGKFELAYNTDGGHQAWVDAACNQIKNNLGIDAAGKPYPDFKSLRAEVTDRKIKTAFRTGWQGDYPGLFNFLGPLYETGGSSNDTDYSNPTVDKLLKDGQAAKSVEEGNKLYEQAQEILLLDLPALPLWYSNANGGWSDKVSDVVFNWQGVPQFYKIIKK